MEDPAHIYGATAIKTFLAWMLLATGIAIFLMGAIKTDRGNPAGVYTDNQVEYYNEMFVGEPQ